MSNNIHPLLEWFGRVPDHYELYPLPDNRKGGTEHSRYGMTMEDGKVLIFEFDFCADDISPGELESLVSHDCHTCRWLFMLNANPDDGWELCQNPPQTPGDQCHSWEISRYALLVAKAEHYKRLHEKHYGKISVSV